MLKVGYFNFQSVKLVQCWIAKPKKKNDDRIEWEAREVGDCRKYLKSIADIIYQQLEKRFEEFSRNYHHFAQVPWFWLIIATQKETCKYIVGRFVPKEFSNIFKAVSKENFIKLIKPSDSNEFSSTESFYVTLDDNSDIEVAVHKQKVIKSLYTDPKLYCESIDNKKYHYVSSVVYFTSITKFQYQILKCSIFPQNNFNCLYTRFYT